ncbi:MAG: thiamine-phosphate kinase [Myxococcales bacterium]
MPTEFQLIERFLAPFGRNAGHVVIGPGDDCAVLRCAPGTELCVTTDALVEGVHFHPALFSDADIGHKALAVNLSDIAAMGAAPRWFVCSIACRPEDAKRIPGIARGMAALAKRADVLIVGGNFSRADTLSIHITAGGEVPKGTALTRSGAKIGDQLYVTGTFGDAALALALRSIDRQAKAVLGRQLRPEPRLKVGAIARRFAHAAIDVSDGLLQDLGHVCESSRVGVRLDAHLVPVSRTFKDVAANLDLALTGGEDYELALFVPPAKCAAFEKACQAAGEKVHRIGAAVKTRQVLVDNAPHLAHRGFDHFGK